MKNLIMGAVLLILLFPCFHSAESVEYSEPVKVAEVLSGARSEAKATWWGFDPEDSTDYLQSAIDSGARKLIVENTGMDWIVRPIKVASNIEIIFQDGVVVRAREGAFRGRTDQLFDIRDRNNVSLRGEGNVLFEMRKTDYLDRERYERSTHRHTINIWASQDVLIQNLTVRSSGGDGVYVGCSPRSQSAKNIIIDRVISEDHYRQAISVTGATNLSLKNSVFNDTDGTAPECGIDIEPNYSECSIVNFSAENCEFSGNAFSGIILALGRIGETSEPVSISFRNCRIRNNSSGIRVQNTGSGTPAKPGRIEFINCEISGTSAESIGVRQHIVANMELVFKDIVIDNRGTNLEAVRISSGRPEDIHGLRIEGLTVIDDEDRPPLLFISRFGNGLVNAVVRDVKTVRSDGTEIVFDTEKFLAESKPDPAAKAFMVRAVEPENLKPLSEAGRAAGGNIGYREKTDYLQYAAAGQEIDISFRNRPVHRFSGAAYRDPLKVEVYNPAGMLIDEFGIPFDREITYALRAGEPGVYRFAIDARMQRVSFETDASGQGIAAAETLYILGGTGSLYFHVPAGVEDIRIEAGGSPRESSTVYLLDPDGNEVDSGVRMEGTKILRHSRRDASEDEVWSIRFSAGKLYLRIGAPLLPVFSSAPENLLIGK